MTPRSVIRLSHSSPVDALIWASRIGHRLTSSVEGSLELLLQFVRGWVHHFLDELTLFIEPPLSIWLIINILLHIVMATGPVDLRKKSEGRQASAAARVSSGSVIQFLLIIVLGRGANDGAGPDRQYCCL